MHLDGEGLYSMDVQSIISNTVQKLKFNNILDACCGVGGASIAFALAGKSVIAIDINSDRLEMAGQNAALFQVENHIQFVQGDALQLVKDFTGIGIYLDPPWGGPNYERLDKFSLSNFNLNGRKLLATSLAISKEVAFKLPRNFDFSEFETSFPPYEIIENTFESELLFYTAIFRPQ